MIARLIFNSRLIAPQWGGSSTLSVTPGLLSEIAIVEMCPFSPWLIQILVPSFHRQTSSCWVTRWSDTETGPHFHIKLFLLTLSCTGQLSHPRPPTPPFYSHNPQIQISQNVKSRLFHISSSTPPTSPKHNHKTSRYSNASFPGYWINFVTHHYPFLAFKFQHGWFLFGCWLHCWSRCFEWLWTRSKRSSWSF